MAVSATVAKYTDGPRNVGVLLTGLGDGQGQENLAIKVLATSLVPVSTSCRVTRINGVVDYGVVELFWDALVPVRFAVLSGQFDIDFSTIGGLPNSGGGGKTGNILLSTLAFELNSTYTINLTLVK